MLSLILLSVVMTVITLAAGWLPFIIPKTLDTSLLSQFGSGIILGSAFLLIIPEGYEQLEPSKLAPLAGASVVAGFLLMLAVNSVMFGRERTTTTAARSNLHEGGFAQDVDFDAPELGEAEAEYMLTSPMDISLTNVRSWFAGINFTTLGLTIHAAADGIALGATSGNSGNSKLEFMVFLSIIVHKAPAAFSLASILLAHTPHAQSQQHIKRDVILFSLAGPVLAVILGGILALLHLSPGFHLLPGICLAFSGGTFLFVATHVLEHAKIQRGEWKSIGIIASGTILPLIASLLPE